MSQSRRFRVVLTLSISLLVAAGPVAAVSAQVRAAPASQQVTSVDTVAGKKKVAKGASLGAKKLAKGASLG